MYSVQVCGFQSKEVSLRFLSKKVDQDNNSKHFICNNLYVGITYIFCIYILSLKFVSNFSVMYKSNYMKIYMIAFLIWDYIFVASWCFLIL